MTRHGVAELAHTLRRSGPSPAEAKLWQAALKRAEARQAVSAVEAGQSDPSLRVALALARVLGTTVEAMFGPVSPAPPVLARPTLALCGAPAARSAPSPPVTRTAPSASGMNVPSEVH